MNTPAPRHRAIVPIHFTCPPAAPTNLPCPACTGGVRRFVCFACAGTGSLDQRIDIILTDAVTDALKMIRAGRPGRGEYALARAQLKVAALAGESAEAFELDWLRYYELGGAA